MNELINSLLGLIFALGAMAIIMLLLVALFRPSVLPQLVETVQKIVLALTRKLPDQEKPRRKRKNDDPPND